MYKKNTFQTKCGFLPNSSLLKKDMAIKSSICRFCMHQLLKVCIETAITILSFVYVSLTTTNIKEPFILFYIEGFKLQTFQEILKKCFLSTICDWFLYIFLNMNYTLVCYSYERDNTFSMASYYGHIHAIMFSWLINYYEEGVRFISRSR